MSNESSLLASLRRVAGQSGVLLAACICVLAACSTQRPGGAQGVTYPLDQCLGKKPKKPCVAELFADDTLIATRESRGFPQYYLEIADPTVRQDYCRDNFPDSGDNAKCLKRLEAVADYFNPKGSPDPNDLAVALEGGGTKAAPFGLGVLAGLDEMGLLQERVKAIGSISGGSYAASYYYNRLYDLHDKGAPIAGDHAQWFRSCIPDYFSPHFEASLEQRCDRAAPLHWCGESNSCPVKHERGFDSNYKFLGHVWTNADLLRGSAEGNLGTSSSWGMLEFGNVALLGTETAVTIPYQFLARTVFRWPMNSSPTKLAYKLGLEREYGYSPEDWAAAGDTEIAHFWNTLQTRRKDRTISGLAGLTDPAAGKPPLQPPPPLWIIGTTAPGKITGGEWLHAAARDPLRQQFEITPYGYGSGTYGYARQAPDAPFDFLGRNPGGLPILDAVVASGAFLDEDETQISTQPLHFFGAATLHFTNLTWFTEIPNFNVGDTTRLLENATPWPLYLIDTNRLRRSPYIHLQDGGNAENSGIFPLLRRGYKTILYAHETQDTQAEFASICHLKNHLELDGSYVLISPDLERLVSPSPVAGSVPKHQGRAGRFRTYLDGLCSSQMDASDLVAFDQNPKRDAAQRDAAVARLYCARLGYKSGSPFKPCKEYFIKFGLPEPHDGVASGEPPARCAWSEKRLGEADTGKPPPGDQDFALDRDLLYFWRSDTVLRFVVYRGKATECDAGDAQSFKDRSPVSTVISLVPGVSLDEITPQLDGEMGAARSWRDLCGRSDRASVKIKYCPGPDGHLWSGTSADRKPAGSGVTAGDGPGLSCTALAHLLEDRCGANASHPSFPQDSYVWETLHDPYTTYAAYFDLGRHLVRRAIFCKDDLHACEGH